MKAIILAAGEGKRLRPLTDEKPKCLVELFGKSLLEWQIEVFRSCNVKDIAIVTGYHNEKIVFPNLTYFHNKKYDKTNMLESLLCARSFLTGDVIVSYGDIIFEKKVLEELIKSKFDLSVTVDKNWKNLWERRFKEPLIDAESLVIDKSSFISDIGQKVSRIEDICAQFIGLMKFSEQALIEILAFYDKVKNQSKNGKNPLNSSLTLEKSFMTDFIQGLIKNGEKVAPVIVKNGWLELDSLKDYEMYCSMYNNGTISEFFSIKND